MLSIKENFLETLRPDGSPDRLVNGFEFMKLILPDPVLIATGHGLREPGRDKDAWNVTWELIEGQPAAAPYHGPGATVLEEIENWQDIVVFPDLEQEMDWSLARSIAADADPLSQFTCAFVPGGLFERLHMLMGFEGALVSIMTEPEATKALLDAIAVSRMRYHQLLVENLHPEMFLVHDDWGMKNNLFMSPEVWREMFKPHYQELYAYLHSEGCVVVHHADSFLEPIIEDLVEIGIDVWQGALPQNDIVALQAQLAGRMTMMGGIDAAIIDNLQATEADIRAEVRRACSTYGPGGHFIPSETYGGPGYILRPGGAEILASEIADYNREVYGL